MYLWSQGALSDGDHGVKSIKSFLNLYFKGLAMGAADVVPGVSGGTIAFITGIYQELLETISAFSRIGNYQILFRQGIKPFWQTMNGNFIVVLFAGISTSIFSLAKIITYLLENQPELVWSFFFGLIVVSCGLIAKEVEQWNLTTLVLLIVGCAVAYTITVVSPASVEATYPMIFFAGAIAICAMILPGISGSFILLLMGMYGPIMGAIKNLDITVLMIFTAGTATGLISFSRILSWVYSEHKDFTLALLTGFLVGSLNAVWPWKHTLEFRINSHGQEVPFLRENVSPIEYLSITGHESHLLLGSMLMIAAIVFVMVLHWLGQKLSDG